MHNYNVIVLGPSGSGKTVYLASMYKSLSIQKGHTSFFLETNAEQRKLLINKYTQIAGPGDWPPPTQYREISEWQFRVCVENESQYKFPAFQFTYLDYAGERIVDAKQDGAAEAEFETRLQEADALVGILDGRRILSLMRGESDSQIFLLRELQNILDIMQGTRCPGHFVITKWDLLDGKYSLGEVRDELLKNEDFKALVKQRSKTMKLPLRLIPISSVGNGFAELQPDGEMRKIPGAQPKPFQVEMPLACVLPDQLKTQLEKIKEKELKIQSESIETEPDLSLWDIFGELIGSGLRTVRQYLRDEFQLDDNLLKLLISYAEMGARGKREEAEKRSEELRLEKEESLKLVRDDKTAIEHAIRSFGYLVSVLERDFPESNLSSI